MGKGDKKSGKGKRWRGTYGNTRKRKPSKSTAASAAKTEKAAPKAKKTAAKKTTARKSAKAEE